MLKITSAAVLAAAFLFSGASAQILIAYGGDYVSETQASQAPVDQDSTVGLDSIRYVGGFGTAVNPPIGADYSGPAFTGGGQVFKLGGQAGGQAQISVEENGANDFIKITLRYPNNADVGSSLSGFVLFDAGGVQYGNLTSISGRSAGGMNSATTSRFMIETTSGDFFVSQTNITGGFGGSLWDITDMENENWAAFNPGPDITTDELRGDFGSLDFNQTITPNTQIANIGWFGSAVTTNTSAANRDITIQDFTVIPEPSAYAALAGLIGLGLVLLRRRR